MNCFSLFERWEAPHRHFESDADVMNELHALLSKAINLFKEDVLTQRKSYDRFVEDFYHGNRYIRCDNPICRNIHEVNLHIVHRLLTSRQDLVLPILNSRTFSLEDCLLLKRSFDQPECNPPKVFPTFQCNVKARPLSFGCNLTKEQIMRISAIATANYLFSFYGTPHNDLHHLFECKQGFSLVVLNLRNVAVMFDTLYEIGLIGRGWQTVIERKKLLYSRNGTPVTATSLSSALSAIKKNPTAEANTIRLAIKGLSASENMI